MAVNTGLGATITAWPASASPGNWKVISISGFNVSVEALDDTSLASTNFQEMVPADLKAIGPISVECFWNWDEALPTVGTAGTFTFSFPDQSDSTDAGNLSGTGFVTEVETPTLTSGEPTTGSITIQFDGKTGPTWTQNS